MLPRPIHSARLVAFSFSLLAGLPVLLAQTVNWDGNGASNTGGNWTTDANWAGDLAPSTTAITAGLVSVTSGTRTISINTGETVTAKNLLFTQSTAGATNVLSVASGGTLNLGGGQTWAAPTAGTSRVELGGTIDFTGLTSGNVTVGTALTFTNAGAVFRSSNANGNPVFIFNGAVGVNAGSGTARITYTGGNRPISTTFGAASTLTIDTGTLEISTPGYTSNPGVTVALQGTTTIASGTALRLIADNANTAAGGSAGVLLTNSGSLGQAGTIMTNGRGSGGTTTLTNSGSWKVDGLGAVLEKGNRATAANPTFANTATGVFSGTSADDRIDYNHLASPGTNLAFGNSGVIAAGDGTSGPGLASVGTLTLVDLAITNTSTASLAFDVGGSGAGQFDVLVLQSGSVDFTNATLAITLVNGFAPSSSFSIPIFIADGATSVAGSFADITVNGLAAPDYAFSYDSGTGVGSLTFTSAIPEPSTAAALLGFAALGCVALRRRARASA